MVIRVDDPHLLAEGGLSGDEYGVQKEDDCSEEQKELVRGRMLVLPAQHDTDREEVHHELHAWPRLVSIWLLSAREICLSRLTIYYGIEVVADVEGILEQGHRLGHGKLRGYVGGLRAGELGTWGAWSTPVAP